MQQEDGRSLLGFGDIWFSLGILTEEQLQSYVETYTKSDDKNTEHYRWAAFRAYLQQHRPLSATMAESLYDLGALEPDRAMGGAIMANILLLPECPTALVDKSLVSDRKHLVQLSERKRLLSEIHPQSQKTSLLVVWRAATE